MGRLRFAVTGQELIRYFEKNVRDLRREQALSRDHCLMFANHPRACGESTSRDKIRLIRKKRHSLHESMASISEKRESPITECFQLMDGPNPQSDRACPLRPYRQPAAPPLIRSPATLAKRWSLWKESLATVWPDLISSTASSRSPLHKEVYFVARAVAVKRLPVISGSDDTRFDCVRHLSYFL